MGLHNLLQSFRVSGAEKVCAEPEENSRAGRKRVDGLWPDRCTRRS